MKWAVWYEDGSVYTSDQTSWVDLPPVGVQIVFVYNTTGRTRYSGADWYWYYDGEFGYIPSGDWGTNQPFPSNIKCKSCVKKGTGVEDKHFLKILKSANGYNIHTN